MKTDKEYFKTHFFRLERYHASAVKFSADEPEQDEATVKLSVPAANLKKKKIEAKYRAEYQPADRRYVSLSATANGDGTVDALDKALRKLLVPVYPFLGGVRLIRYSVQNASLRGTSSEVEVFILAANKSGKLYYSAVLSNSVIEASFFALSNIYNRYFLDDVESRRAKSRKE